MVKQLPPIIQVGDVLLSSDILTEKFCCDLSACKGECCVEGDAGAPVTFEEVAEIEDCLDVVWDDLSASAQAVIDKQGVCIGEGFQKWQDAFLQTCELCTLSHP